MYESVVNVVRELILGAQDHGRRQEIVESINESPAEFKAFLDGIFDSEENHTEEKTLVLDLVDFLSPILGMEVVRRAISDSDRQTRIRGFQAAYRRQFDTLNRRVLEVLQDSTECFEVRKWAVHILGGTDPVEYAKYLRKIMRDPNEDVRVRKEAIYALTNASSNVTIGAFCALLGDTNVEIRQASAWALGKVGTDVSVDCLLAALEDTDEIVRDWAIRGLRDSDNTRALQGLAEAMKILDPAHQRQLIRLVVEKRSEVISRAIVELLGTSDVEVRKLAAWAMGVSPYPPATSELERLLDDDDAQIREYAKKALERLGWANPTDFGLMI